MKEGRLNGFSCNSRSSTAILRSTVPSRRPSRTLVDRGSIEAKYSLLLDARRQAAKREKMLQLVPHKEREHLARPEKSLQLIHLPTAAPPERRLQLVQRPTTASPERRLQLVQMPTAAPVERKLQLVPLPSAPPLERRMKVVERSNGGKVSPEHDFQVLYHSHRDQRWDDGRGSLSLSLSLYLLFRFSPAIQPARVVRIYDQDGRNSNPHVSFSLPCI